MSKNTKINISEPLKASWSIYQKNLSKILPIYALLNLPAVYATYIADQRAQELSDELTSSIEGGEFDFSLVTDYFSGSIFNLEGFISTLFTAVATLFVSIFIYQVVMGKKANINSAFNMIKKNAVNLIIAYVLLNIAVTIGSILLIIPGLLVSLFGIFTYQVVAIENKSAIDAYKESAKLVNKEAIGAVGYLILVFIILAVIASILTGITGVIVGSVLSIPVTMFGAVFVGVFYAKRKDMKEEE